MEALNINKNNPSKMQFAVRRIMNFDLKDKYPNFEVGLKCIIMVF